MIHKQEPYCEMSVVNTVHHKCQILTHISKQDTRVTRTDTFNNMSGKGDAVDVWIYHIMKA